MTPTRPALRDSVLVLAGEGDELHFLMTSSSTRKTFSVDPVARRLVALLDGSRSVGELEAELSEAPAGHVRDVLGVLEDEQLLAAPVAIEDEPVPERHAR